MRSASLKQEWHPTIRGESRQSVEKQVPHSSLLLRKRCTGGEMDGYAEPSPQGGPTKRESGITMLQSSCSRTTDQSSHLKSW